MIGWWKHEWRKTLEDMGGHRRTWEDIEGHDEDIRGHGRIWEDIGGRTWEGRTLEDKHYSNVIN